MARWIPAPDAAPIHLGKTNLVFEEQRRFVRKSITLAVAIVVMAPLIYYKDTHELSVLLTRIYLVALVVIHVFALGVFVHRVPWRALFRHPMSLLTRGGGLVIFGVLLAMLEFDSASPWFWGALTLLWAFHVGALALLHVRHRREASPTDPAHGGCPVGPFAPSASADAAEPDAAGERPL